MTIQYEYSATEIINYIITILTKPQIKSALETIEEQRKYLMTIPLLQTPETDNLKTKLEYQLKHYNLMHRKSL